MEGWNIAPFKFNHLPETQTRKEWMRWKRNFEVIAAVSEEENTTKLRNILLAKGGLELQDLFYSIDGANVEEDKENGIDPYKTAIDKLDQHFSPKQHDSFERNEFCKLSPTTVHDGTCETLSKFLIRCSEQAKRCDFGNTGAESRDLRIIDKVIYHAPTELREKLLHEEKLTLARLTRMVNCFESIKLQARTIAETGSEKESMTASENVERINKLNIFSNSNRNNCYRCGSSNHQAADRECPARGRKCEKCHKIGHYAKVCRSGSNFKRRYEGSTEHRPEKRARFGNVRAIVAEELNQSDPECFIFNIGDGDEFLWTKIGGVLIQVLIDSGSSKNIIDDRTWEYMKKRGLKSWIPRDIPNTILRGYGRDAKPLKIVNVFEAVISVESTNNKFETTATFFVVEGGLQSLLGKETAKCLRVLKIGLPNPEHSVNVVVPMIKRSFPKMKNVQVRIPIDQDTTPVVQRARRPPIALLSRIEEKLEQLLATDIIEPVSGPSPWVSPLVTIVKDNGDLRLCVDMRRPNQAIQREYHVMPTFEDFLPHFKSAQFFSRLDIKDAFHQVRILEEN